MTDSAFEPDVDWALIPERMRAPLRLYVEEHRPVGDFLTAVLSNDLRGAVSRADDDNIARLPDFSNFLQWYCPSLCWGSPEKVRAWLAQRPAHVYTRLTVEHDQRKHTEPVDHCPLCTATRKD
jgi:hypothetical protein